MMSYIKSLAISALSVFLPIKPVLLVSLVLCLVDLVLGVTAAKKRKERISSKGLGRTIVKIAVYEIAICCGFLVQKYMLSDATPLVNIIAGLIGATEMKSVLENLDSISGDSFFKSVVEKLGSKSNKSGPGEK
jgi:hypothetical protein